MSCGNNSTYADEPHTPTPLYTPDESDAVDEHDPPSPLSPRPSGTASPPPPLDLSRQSSRASARSTRSSIHSVRAVYARQTSGSPPSKGLPPPPPRYSEDQDDIRSTEEFDSDPKATAKLNEYLQHEQSKPSVAVVAAPALRPNPFADFPAPPPLIIQTSMPAPGVGIRGGGPAMQQEVCFSGGGGPAAPPPAVHLPTTPSGVINPKPRRYPSRHSAHQSADSTSADFQRLISGTSSGGLGSPVAADMSMSAQFIPESHTPAAAMGMCGMVPSVVGGGGVILANPNTNPANIMMNGVISGRASRTNSDATQRAHTPGFSQLMPVPCVHAPGSDTSAPSSPRSHLAQVNTFLARINCSQYAERLFAEGYDSMDALKEITDEELNELQVKKGHRKVIMRRVAEWDTGTVQYGPSASTFMNTVTTPNAFVSSDGCGVPAVPQFMGHQLSYNGSPTPGPPPHLMTPHAHTHTVNRAQASGHHAMSTFQQFSSLPTSRAQTPELTAAAKAALALAQRSRSELYQPQQQTPQSSAIKAFDFRPQHQQQQQQQQSAPGRQQMDHFLQNQANSPPSRSKSPQPLQLCVPRGPTPANTRESRSQSCDGYLNAGVEQPNACGAQKQQYQEPDAFQSSDIVYHNECFASPQIAAISITKPPPHAPTRQNTMFPPAPQPSPPHTHSGNNFPRSGLQTQSTLSNALTTGFQSDATIRVRPGRSMSVNIEQAEAYTNAVPAYTSAPVPVNPQSGVSTPRLGIPSLSHQGGAQSTFSAFRRHSTNRAHPPVFHSNPSPSPSPSPNISQARGTAGMAQRSMGSEQTHAAAAARGFGSAPSTMSGKLARQKLGVDSALFNGQSRSRRATREVSLGFVFCVVVMWITFFRAFLCTACSTHMTHTHTHTHVFVLFCTSLVAHMTHTHIF